MSVRRTALLTGAAGGLGRVMAEAMAQGGHRVALIDTSDAALDKLTMELRASHPAASLLPMRLDLADDSGFGSAIARLEDALGPIDVLINNAGLYISAVRDDYRQRPLRFWDLEAETLKRFFRVNAIAPMLLAARLVPGMIERRFGRIINVTTSLSTMIRKGVTPYGGTKASLEAHSAIMAKDLEGTGVTVNVLVPGGAADTPMIPAGYTDDRSALIAPTVMAQPLMWLMSDGAAQVTGRRIMAVQWNPDKPDDVPQAAWPNLP